MLQFMGIIRLMMRGNHCIGRSHTETLRLDMIVVAGPFVARLLHCTTYLLLDVTSER